MTSDGNKPRQRQTPTHPPRAKPSSKAKTAPVELQLYHQSQVTTKAKVAAAVRQVTATPSHRQNALRHRQKTPSHPFSKTIIFSFFFSLLALQRAKPLLHVRVAVNQHGKNLRTVQLVLVELLDLQPLQQEPQHAQRGLAQRWSQAWTCLRVHHPSHQVRVCVCGGYDWARQTTVEKKQGGGGIVVENSTYRTLPPEGSPAPPLWC